MRAYVRLPFDESHEAPAVMVSLSDAQFGCKLFGPPMSGLLEGLVKDTQTKFL